MAKVTEDRKVLDTLIKNLRKLEEYETQAGILSSEPHPTYEGSIAELGALYEFGYLREDGAIVEARFIDPVDRNKSGYRKIIQVDSYNLVERLANGRLNPVSLLEEFGKEMSEAYRAYIKSNSVQFIAPNAVGGRSKSGQGVTLIESTTLVDSIDSDVVKKGKK